MKIALHFRPSETDSVYGMMIRRRFLEELAECHSDKHHLKVSVGDLLVTEVRRAEGLPIRETVERVVQGVDDEYMEFEPSLNQVLESEKPHVVSIEGINPSLLQCIHKGLEDYPPYFGFLRVDFDKRLHTYLYRSLLIPKYRLWKGELRELYVMGSEEAEDQAESRLSHFTDTEFEAFGTGDLRTRHTAFDETDLPQREEKWASADQLLGSMDNPVVTGTLPLLKDYSPQLMDSISSASKALRRSETAEDIAHVAVSCRRFLKHLADLLFEPREDPVNGHEVTEADYVNRIWAYLQERLPEDSPSELSVDVQDLGERVDDLYDDTNKGVHGDATIEEGTSVLIDCIRLIDTLATEVEGRPGSAPAVGMEEFNAWFAERISGDAS